MIERLLKRRSSHRKNESSTLKSGLCVQDDILHLHQVSELQYAHVTNFAAQETSLVHSGTRIAGVSARHKLIGSIRRLKILNTV